MNDFLVSIVIPTKDSAGTLSSCLESIQYQTCKNTKVTLVDCFSNDATNQVARRYGAHLICISSRRSEARNKGAKQTKGDFLLFIDSDMELDQNVIIECISQIMKGYDALIIPEVSIGHGFWVKCRVLEKSCYVGDSLIEAARFFKRDVFLSIGGYDRALEAGEDWDINERIIIKGFKIGRIESHIAHNEGSLSLLTAIRKKYKYGQTVGLYLSKQPYKSHRQLGIQRLAVLRNPLMAQDPVHAMGLVFLKSCEAVAFFSGFLYSKTAWKWTRGKRF